MPETVREIPYELDEEIRSEIEQAVQRLVTEDDTPVDNLFSAKQQTLLKRALYSSWRPAPVGEQPPGQRRLFLADANIAVYFGLNRPPLVPDFFLSLDVQPHEDWYEKRHRSYFVWEFGKAPDVVLEIVSNREGSELAHKLADYAQMGARYYVVYDPTRRLGEEQLYVHELEALHYRRRADAMLPELGLGLTLWEGVFEDKTDTWLRWTDGAGRLLPTGEERAARLAARLREMGIDPDEQI
ncbi:MAG: Uma2 family endonuclease [Blastocatellia bacterium]